MHVVVQMLSTRKCGATLHCGPLQPSGPGQALSPQSTMAVPPCPVLYFVPFDMVLYDCVRPVEMFEPQMEAGSVSSLWKSSPHICGVFQ